MFSGSLLAVLALRQVDVTGSSGKIDYHHGIVTKADAMGLPPAERIKIDDPRNILLIDHDEHVAGRIPSRGEASKILRNIYGEYAVREWFYNIRFKRRMIFPE